MQDRPTARDDNTTEINNDLDLNDVEMPLLSQQKTLNNRSQLQS